MTLSQALRLSFIYIEVVKVIEKTNSCVVDNTTSILVDRRV